jgi:flagellin-like protein
MKKLLKNKKALSPVVAAIILIAVTVAVSIAVAAWMGSLTIGFMETTELTITDMVFDSTTAETITLSITNSGTSSATISGIRVNGETIALTGTGAGTATGTVTYAAGASASDLVISLTDVVAGNKYSVSLFANDGTMIGSYTGTSD